MTSPVPSRSRRNASLASRAPWMVWVLMPTSLSAGAMICRFAWRANSGIEVAAPCSGKLNVIVCATAQPRLDIPSVVATARDSRPHLGVVCRIPPRIDCYRNLCADSRSSRTAAQVFNLKKDGRGPSAAALEKKLFFSAGLEDQAVAVDAQLRAHHGGRGIH